MRQSWRFFGFALAAALAACGRADGPEAPAQAPVVPASEQTLSERYVDLLPQWIPIANTADGGSIAYDLKGLQAAMAQGRNEVLVQVRHGAPTEWRLAEGSVERVISFQLEQVRMRFDCEKETFLVLERRVLNPDGTVMETIKTPEAELSKPQKISGNGLASVTRDPACVVR